MGRATTRRKLAWELDGSWIFESSGDGTILFYPHGWGRAYVVPTEDKRREIEAFLALWLATLRAALRVSRWILPLLVLVFIAFLFPPFCRVVWYAPGARAVFRLAVLLGALGCLLTVGSPLALRFLAETAKVDLEKSQVRRPFAESLRNYAQRSDLSRLWIEEALYALVLLEGVWLLWPRQETIMLPARINTHLLPGGVALVVLGGVMALVKLWEIRAKLRA